MTDTNTDDTYRFGHFFADHGAESEVLGGYGDVYRATLSPHDNPAVKMTQEIDLMEETPDVRVELGIFHPVCARWAKTTPIDGTPEDHPNMIPRAREIAAECCEFYVIENVPQAPLDDPVVLDGKMFGLPIKYARAFESNFPIKAPPRYAELDTECSPYFSSDRTAEWWRSVKGYRGEYPKEHLAKNCLPAAYVQAILRSWFRTIHDRDGVPAQDNNSPAPRRVTSDQATLGQEVDDERRY